MFNREVQANKDEVEDEKNAGEQAMSDFMQLKRMSTSGRWGAYDVTLEKVPKTSGYKKKEETETEEEQTQGVSRMELQKSIR
jgi:hypothetical protein